MFTVYHYKNTRFDVSIYPTNLKLVPDNGTFTFEDNDSILFVPVANVYTDIDNLDEAFRLTNSINTYWPLNEGVIPLPDCDGEFRSTSVGDLIVRRVDGEPTSYFIVDMAGFKKASSY